LAVDLVTGAQGRLEFPQVLVAEPVEEGRVAEAVWTGRKQDHRPTRLHRLYSVIQGFVGLDEVDVLGVPAAGDDRQVGGPRQRYGEELPGQGAAGQMRLLEIAAEDRGDPLVRGQYGVEQEVRGDHPRRGQNRLVHGVAVQHRRTGPGLPAADFRRVEDGEVGGHAGAAAGDAGDQPLAAAAETGEIMQADGTGNDHPVGLDHPSVDLDRQAARRPAEIDQLGRVVAIVIGHCDPAVGGAEDLAVLGVSLPAVNPQAFSICSTN